ncbi:glutaminyl-tRNA synthase (glutamine-hydrolyzing) subunit A [Candidatus Saccharibacteria bacterium 32-49-12]|nr:MAG: glutaminyl-tRNA synthase (glutamine-hydrolyzing) subunit A [Candidatus Saccharibacteria bacterium 32-49-12]
MKISDYLQNSATENVQKALEIAKSKQDFGALLSLTEGRALERARAVDAGEFEGRLKGVPFVVKDNFLAYGGPSTAASKMLESFSAPLQATAIERLEAEGAICIGKANLDAFAHGGSTENSAYGPTKNAFDPQRVAGGSSGGSAVSVALDIVPFALGSDTGGSIRQPASFNGVVGVKPTYGTVSRYGVVAMASSTDTIGCFANNSDDASLVMEIMAGVDVNDMTTLDHSWADTPSFTRKRVGVVKQFMTSDVDEEVRQATIRYAESLESQGYAVDEVDLPMADYSLAMYYIIMPAEVMSNLARYDGVHYGHRADNVTTLAELYGKSRDEGFEAENKRRIMIGSFVLSSGYFDAYYLKAQKARTLLIDEFKKLFENYDVLIGPVAPTPAFRLGENTQDPIKMYLADVMTAPASMAGLPAISVPGGLSNEGLPIGVQLIGNYKTDRALLELASQMEGIA